MFLTHKNKIGSYTQAVRIVSIRASFHAIDIDMS